jgi:hypothetical protein
VATTALPETESTIGFPVAVHLGKCLSWVKREFSRPPHLPTLHAFVRRGKLGAKASLHAYPRSARGA